MTIKAWGNMTTAATNTEGAGMTVTAMRPQTDVIIGMATGDVFMSPPPVIYAPPPPPGIGIFFPPIIIHP